VEIIENVVGHPSVMLNKTLLGNEALYEYMTTEDWYLWIRLLTEGDYEGKPVKFGHIYERLHYYRIH